ncbi:MAG: phosphatidylinositol kinase, partial [Actinomycetota bacterium]
LRTVIWEFGGELMSDDLRARVQRVADSPPLDVTSLLFDDEADALVERASLLAQGGAFPIDASGHRYPWPMV